jgi:hypothetical protein
MSLSHKIKRKVINQTSLLLNLLWSTRRISIGGHPGALLPQHPACPLCHLESRPPLARCGPTWLIMYLTTWSSPLFTRTLMSPHFSSINLIYSCDQAFLWISHARSLGIVPVMAMDSVALAS